MTYTDAVYVQFQVAPKMSAGVLQNLDSSLFTVTSVDNIDFLQRHFFVYSGEQGRSWHGTSTGGSASSGTGNWDYG